MQYYPQGDVTPSFGRPSLDDYYRAGYEDTRREYEASSPATFSVPAGGLSRLERFESTVSALDRAWPNLTPFQRRSVARVIVSVMDWRLTAGNYLEATLRGEIVKRFEEEDPELGRNANIVNFLILLNRAIK